MTSGTPRETNFCENVLAKGKSRTLFSRSIRKNNHERNKRYRSRRHAVHRRQFVIISPKCKLMSGFVTDTDRRIPGAPSINNKMQIPNHNLCDIPAPWGQGNNLTNNAGSTCKYRNASRMEHTSWRSNESFSTLPQDAQVNSECVSIS